MSELLDQVFNLLSSYGLKSGLDNESTETSLYWPPDYYVRESNRAKRVSVIVKYTGKIEVVKPARLKRFNADKFIEQHKTWIISRLQEIEANGKSIIREIPPVLNLAALEQDWQVQTQSIETDKINITSPHFLELLLTGPVNDQSLCRGAIRKWLQKRAKKVLPPWLDAISQRCELPYRSLRINTAKTRWGSCSAQKNLNLNAKLLLVPQVLVEHTMLHELCHTVHLDHSDAFWQLLTKYDPLTPQHRQQLRQYQSPMLQWLDADG